MPKSVVKPPSSAGNRKSSRTSTLTPDLQPPMKKFKSLSQFTVPPNFALKESSQGSDASSSELVSRPTPSPTNDKSKGKEREVTDTSLDAGVLWVDRYQPVTTAELAVHRKKVDDVRHWFMEALGEGGASKYRRILALTGPAGSGKTATVKLLARELNFELVEWRNSVIDPYGDPDAIPQLDKFQAFLTRASTSRSIFGASSSRPGARQVILLEDLPNVLHAGTREQFQDILRFFVQREVPKNGGYVPLVLIMSDAGTRGEPEDIGGSSSFRGRKEVLEIRGALPPDLLSAPFVTNVSFNPIAPTLMIKALQAVANRHFHDSSSLRPTKNILETITTCSRGDIRGAIMELQLSSLINRKPVGKSKKRGPNDSIAQLKLVSQREQSLALFHLIGKVMYNKRKGDPPSSSATKREKEQLRLFEHSIPDPEKLPSHLESHDREASLVDVDALYADSPIDSSLFSLYLHQNYTQFCNELEECGDIAEWMSWIDYSGPEEWFQTNPHRFHLLTLGTLHSLPVPVPRRSQKMSKPDFFEQLKRGREASDAAWDVSDWFSREMTQVCGRWNKDDLVCEAGTILNGPSSSHLKLPRLHKLFSRLTFDNGDSPLSYLEEGDSASQHDPNEDAYVKREAEAGDQTLDGGWLEGDDIEDF